MRQIRTRTKVFAGFAAALAVAAAIALGSRVAIREVAAQLDVVSAAQFPTARALAGVNAGFGDAQRFLNTLALSRITAPVFRSGDCAGCHDGTGLFTEGADRALKRLEASVAELEKLPRTPVTAEGWPPLRAGVHEWLEKARTMRARLQSRDAAGASASPAVEAAVWEAWRELHNLSDPLGAAIGKLEIAIRDEAQRSHDAGAAAQHRLDVLQLSVVLLSGLALVLIGWFIGRSVDRAIAALVDQTGRLTSAAVRGELEVRGDEAAVPEEFRAIVRGFNGTLDAVVHPLRVACEVVDRISKGDIPPRIEERFEGEFGRLRDDLNALIDEISGLLGDMTTASRAHAAGDTDAKVDAARFAGAWHELAAGVNAAVGGYVAILDEVLAILGRYADGDFAPVLRALPGKQARANERLALVRENLQTFSADVQALARAAVEGRLDARAAADRYRGDWRLLVDGVNGTLDAVTGPVRAAAGHVDRLARGDVPGELRAGWPGEFGALERNLDRSAAAVRALLADADALARAAQEGRLSTRAEPDRHEGDYRKIVAGLNRTLDAAVAPVVEASQVLARLAARDLGVRMNGDYAGDHARIQEAVNGAAASLQEAIAQVAHAVDQVSAASTQIAASSQAVAAGASQQASALDETSHGLEDMAAMTQRSTGGAAEADALARQARDAARAGAEATGQMTAAMGRIRQASENTAQIIKDVTDIAFQTNLLALNAAVEAARAGDAGRGFAVVAEEVRSLALRSKEAASRTAELIAGAVKQSEEGEATSRVVQQRLAEIAGLIGQVSERVAGISGNAREQATGIAEASKAVAEVDKVTQQNAASAEQSSAAAGELAGEARELEAVVASFKLAAGPGGPGAAPRAMPVPTRRP